jgi:hypothetical protein
MHILRWLNKVRNRYIDALNGENNSEHGLREMHQLYRTGSERKEHVQTPLLSKHKEDKN